MPTVQQMIRALAYTIITFGSSHLIISYVLMVVRDPNEGNLFRILNFQKLFPGIDYGWDWFIISNIIAVGGYLCWLGFIMYRTNKHKKTIHKAAVKEES
jgi:hypothetical protein